MIDIDEYNKEFKKKIRLFLIVLILIIFIRNQTFDNTVLRNVDMEPFSPPIQEPIVNGKTFEHKTSEGMAYITPIANYRIYGRVADIHFRPSKLYWAAVYPYDITIAFGEFEHKEVFSNVKFKMVDTVVYWMYSDQAWDKHLSKYIDSHSELSYSITNNHICPANKRILKGLKKLKKKDVVYIEGYLIKFEHKTKKGKIEQGISSTSRNSNEDAFYGDNGSGSCEQIYVTRIVSRHGDYR